MMTFEEALKHYKKGKKIRRKHWMSHIFVSQSSPLEFGSSDFDGENWELFKEVNVVETYQWGVKFDKHFETILNLYTKEEIYKLYPNNDKIAINGPFKEIK